ncbi:MAG: division/cell wall cluster transcriptional repressor MraZ [Pirellulales bacterium]
MLLTGTFPRVVDDKQRIALPKRIREVLEAGPDAKQLGLFLTPGTDSSLALYREDSLTALGERLAAASPNRRDVRAFGRAFYAQAERIELDDQNRFRIPAALVTHAGLTKEVVLLGVQDHLEIWDKQRWERYLAEQSAEFDRIAEEAFGALPPHAGT